MKNFQEFLTELSSYKDVSNRAEELSNEAYKKDGLHAVAASAHRTAAQLSPTTERYEYHVTQAKRHDVEVNKQ